MDKVLIIMPAFNEAANIGKVISAIKSAVPYADILVVNDGSKDSTGRIAREQGVKVVDLPYNLGIGAAMQSGYRYADAMGYDIAVQVDSDGQHPADQIGDLLRPIAGQRADVVIGSRFLGKGEYVPSLARNIGIKVFSWAVSVITQQRVTDPTSGFRSANREVIRFYSRSYPEDYPEVEAIVLLHKAGFNIEEVPVRMEARTGGKSSITPVRAVYYMIKVLLAVFIDLLKVVERGK